MKYIQESRTLSHYVTDDDLPDKKSVTVTEAMSLKVAHLLGLCGLLTATQASQYWAPKLLGSFYLKDAGFVEAFENPQASDSDKFTLYFTTFNFGEQILHEQE